MKIGEVLKAYRQKRNLSQAEMALEIDLPHSTLCRIEKGKTFETDSFVKIMNWLMRP